MKDLKIENIFGLNDEGLARSVELTEEIVRLTEGVDAMEVFTSIYTLQCVSFSLMMQRFSMDVKDMIDLNTSICYFVEDFIRTNFESKDEKEKI